jgi:lipid-A-disaccharide synthase
MKFYIIAGEASGDLHGANLVNEIKASQPNTEFRGFGGDKMINAGADVVVHYKNIAFMGFKEVFVNLTLILKTLKFCKSDIKSYKPDAIILIDYPGFNLRIAKFAKKAGIKVIYYISPQLWAWKEKRISTIRKYVDKMLCILPFEVDFYKERACEVEYVGHPLVHRIVNFTPDKDFYQSHNLDQKPIIAILPGSRAQEVRKILPVLMSIESSFPDYQFVIAGASGFDKEFYENITRSKDLKIIFDDTYNLLSNAEVGLITSGTATLETALFGVPLVVCYRTSGLTYSLSKMLIKIKYISLVNLILNRPAVRELIQDELNAANLTNELDLLINDKDYRNKMKGHLKDLLKILGNKDASSEAAKIILDYCGE